MAPVCWVDQLGPWLDGDEPRSYAVHQLEAFAAALLAPVREVVDRFTADEAAGYQSRDRQYVIEMLSRLLPPATAPAEP